jgi:hypothetical protein
MKFSLNLLLHSIAIVMEGLSRCLPVEVQVQLHLLNLGHKQVAILIGRFELPFEHLLLQLVLMGQVVYGLQVGFIHGSQIPCLVGKLDDLNRKVISTVLALPQAFLEVFKLEITQPVADGCFAFSALE